MKQIKLAIGAVAVVMTGALFALAGNTNQHPSPAVSLDQPSLSITEKSGHATWLTDFGAAQKKATAEKKFILLDFTGSDWCGWCMKLDGDVFATPEFREFAAKHLTLVRVDFPQHKPQPDSEKAQNEQLASRFQVEGFPTVVVLNADGQLVGTLGYMSGGPKAFIDKLAGMIAS